MFEFNKVIENLTKASELLEKAASEEDNSETTAQKVANDLEEDSLLTQIYGGVEYSRYLEALKGAR